MTGPAWDRVARVVMSTEHDQRPTEWTVEELPREPGQPKNVRVFRYAYRQREPKTEVLLTSAPLRM